MISKAFIPNILRSVREISPSILCCSDSSYHSLSSQSLHAFNIHVSHVDHPLEVPELLKNVDAVSIMCSLNEHSRLCAEKIADERQLNAYPATVVNPQHYHRTIYRSTILGNLVDKLRPDVLKLNLDELIHLNSGKVSFASIPMTEWPIERIIEASRSAASNYDCIVVVAAPHCIVAVEKPAISGTAAYFSIDAKLQNPHLYHNETSLTALVTAAIGAAAKDEQKLRMALDEMQISSDLSPRYAAILSVIALRQQALKDVLEKSQYGPGTVRGLTIDLLFKLMKSPDTVKIEPNLLQ